MEADAASVVAPFTDTGIDDGDNDVGPGGRRLKDGCLDVIRTGDNDSLATVDAAGVGVVLVHVVGSNRFELNLPGNVDGLRFPAPVGATVEETLTVAAVDDDGRIRANRVLEKRRRRDMDGEESGGVDVIETTVNGVEVIVSMRELT